MRAPDPLVGMGSDGEDISILELAKMVKKIEAMGIKTLAYFIKGTYEGDSSLRSFQKMYGKGAVSIDVTNVPQITKTMNGLFLSK